jgi:hypothetical protein
MTNLPLLVLSPRAKVQHDNPLPPHIEEIVPKSDRILINGREVLNTNYSNEFCKLIEDYLPSDNLSKFSAWEKIIDAHKDLLIMCYDLRRLESQHGLSSSQFIAQQKTYKGIIKSFQYAN